MSPEPATAKQANAIADAHRQKQQELMRRRAEHELRARPPPLRAVLATRAEEEARRDSASRERSARLADFVEPEEEGPSARALRTPIRCPPPRPARAARFSRGKPTARRSRRGPRRNRRARPDRRAT